MVKTDQTTGWTLSKSARGTLSKADFCASLNFVWNIQKKYQVDELNEQELEQNVWWTAPPPDFQHHNNAERSFKTCL